MKDRIQTDQPVRLHGGTYEETVAEFRCPHGHGPMDGRYTGMIYAPFDHCGCCGINYPYLDSASYSYGEEVGVPRHADRTWTKGRCPECGGHYVERTW